MSHSSPDWYKSLQGNPLKGDTFTDKSVQLIMNRAKQPAKTRNYKALRMSLVSFAFLSILGITLALNGGDFLKSSTNAGGTNLTSYTPEANADEQTQIGTDVTQGGQPATEIPAQTEQQGEKMPETIDISEVPADEIFVPRSIHDPNSTNTETDSVLKETDIWARNTDDGIILRTTYHSSNGVEIIFSQAPAFKDEDGTISFVKDAYNENVEVTEINGHIVAYVDGESRKAAHLITKDYFFTASTSSLNGTIDDLKNILEYIQLPSADSSTHKRVNITDIKGGINIPLSLEDIFLQKTNADSSANENRIEKLVEVQAYEHDDNVIAIFQLKDGHHEIIFSQSTNKYGNEQSAVEYTKTWYNSSEVKVQEINGHTAVIEDSSDRKQVHLITDTHFYTVSSPGTSNLDYLIELAGEITLE